ncbi:hypothetical protein [Novipirellula artificiosorum]|nr:hypothetical protein [Novipirellula artificiosorum]
MYRFWSSALPLVVLLVISGCAGGLRKIDNARGAFAAGDLDTSAETLSELAESRRRFADAAALDLAMVELARGDARSAEQRFRKLRDQFDAQPKLAPLSEVASIVTDDTARVFRPTGYEQIMIRTMLAVCSLATDGADAESYAMQAVMRQKELASEAEDRGVEDVSQAYQAVAFAPYIRGILREATHHDYDDAAKAYQLVSAVQPSFRAATRDMERASVGSHSAPGHGVLYVIGCVGRGPVLREVEAPTTTSAMQIASSVLNAQNNRDNDEGDSGDVIALPNIASVKVPAVFVPDSGIVAIGVRADGVAVGVTETLTDVGMLAQQQNDAEMPWTIARAVIRRAAKETAVATAGNSLGLSGTAGSLFHFAASSAWSSTEHADTRCWGLLPRQIQVLRVELPAGEYDIGLHSLGPTGMEMGIGRIKPITLIDGKNEYMIAIAPDETIYLAK